MMPLKIGAINVFFLLANNRPYLLETDPAEKRFKFDGETFIRIICKTKTKDIVMHSKNLVFSKREMWLESTPTNVILLNSTAVPNPLTDIITYTLENELQENVPYILHFVYMGQMDDDMHGFYRSSYTDANNNTE